MIRKDTVGSDSAVPQLAEIFHNTAIGVRILLIRVIEVDASPLVKIRGILQRAVGVDPIVLRYLAENLYTADDTELRVDPVFRNSGFKDERFGQLSGARAHAKSICELLSLSQPR